MNIEEIRELVQKVWDDNNDQDIWRLFYEAGKLGVDFEKMAMPGPWLDCFPLLEKAMQDRKTT